MDNNSEFIVIKKTYTFGTCASCDGSGEKKRTFRKMTFVEDCPECDGKGRKRFERKEEFPLTEALKEIEASKEPSVFIQVSDIKKNQ